MPTASRNEKKAEEKEEKMVKRDKTATEVQIRTMQSSDCDRERESRGDGVWEAWARFIIVLQLLSMPRDMR